MPMLKEDTIMDIKRINISAKRQITIPQKFFSKIGFENEAECIMRGNEIVLRPIRSNTSGGFADLILADLIAKGYSGNELLKKFKEAQKEVRPAVEKMLEEAENVAQNKGEYYTFDEVFGDDEI